jgi:hypothetical protein
MVRPGRPPVAAAGAVRVAGCSARAAKVVPVASGVSVARVVSAGTARMPRPPVLMGRTPGMVGTAVPAGVVVPVVAVVSVGCSPRPVFRVSVAMAGPAAATDSAGTAVTVR